MTFWSSSQARRFLFTRESLAQRRADVFASVTSKMPVSLTPNDHRRYIQFFGDRLIENSMKLGFNRYQRYTALALMQRVYVARTLWEIPAPLAMICSLFLVSKFIIPERIDNLLAALGYGTDFAEKFGPGESIASTEISVLVALDFKLKVHLPFHHVLALCCGQPFAERCEECQEFAFELLRTDALLLHPPAHVAVAAVAHVVGISEAIAAAAAIGPAPADLQAIVDAILSLPLPDMGAEEVAAIEGQIGREMAVFRTLSHEADADRGSARPTSVLPP